jgi:ABC-type enterobactin transport system permease subunit
MLAALNIACLVVGGTIAFFASDYPQLTRTMEFSGGLLLIAGLALLGSIFSQAFPW